MSRVRDPSPAPSPFVGAQNEERLESGTVAGPGALDEDSAGCRREGNARFDRRLGHRGERSGPAALPAHVAAHRPTYLLDRHRIHDASTELDVAGKLQVHSRPDDLRS